MKAKKTLSLLLAFALVLSLVPAALAAKFADTKDHWAEAAIDRWSDYGIVTGDGRGFRPDDYMTRAEAAAVLSRLFKLQDAATRPAYKDVSTKNWYYDVINNCVYAGMMEGVGNGRMDPSGLMTREQFFVMFARGLGLPEQSTTKGLPADGHKWSAGLINTMTDRGYVRGMNGKINALENITRASVMALLDQTIVQYIDNSGVQTVDAGEAGKIVLVAAKDVTLKGTTASDIAIAKGVNDGKAELDGVQANALIVAADRASVTVKGSTLGELIVTGDNTTVYLNAKSEVTKSISVPGDNSAVIYSRDSKIPADATAKGINSRIVAQTTSGGGGGGSYTAPESRKHSVDLTANFGGKQVQLSTGNLTSKETEGYNAKQIAEKLVTGTGNVNEIKNAIQYAFDAAVKMDGENVKAAGMTAALGVKTVGSGDGQYLLLSAGVNPVSLMTAAPSGPVAPKLYVSSDPMRATSAMVLASADTAALQALLEKLQKGTETITVADLKNLGELKDKAAEVKAKMEDSGKTDEEKLQALTDKVNETLGADSELAKTAVETINEMNPTEIAAQANDYKEAFDAAEQAVVQAVIDSGAETGVEKGGMSDEEYKAAVLEQITKATPAEVSALDNAVTDSGKTVTVADVKVGDKPITEITTTTTQIDLKNLVEKYLYGGNSSVNETVIANRATTIVDKLNAQLDEANRIEKDSLAYDKLVAAYKVVDPAKLIKGVNNDGQVETITKAQYYDVVKDFVEALGDFWTAYAGTSAQFNDLITNAVTIAHSKFNTTLTPGSTLNTFLAEKTNALYNYTAETTQLVKVDFTTDNETYDLSKATLGNWFNQAKHLPAFSSLPSQLKDKTFSLTVDVKNVTDL